MSSTARLAELRDFPDHSAELAVLVGQASGAPNLSPDAVNLPMIRHWVEAMGDHNPVYVSDEAAAANGLTSLIAPPTMLQAWIMRGLRASDEIEAARAAGASQGDGSSDRMMALLDAEGLTSVVATNCEQHYDRPLVIGDRVMVRSGIEAISEPKRTGLGIGRFITTRLDFTALPDAEVPADPSDEQIVALFARGEPVATMRFRILKYLPPKKAPAQPPRPRPAQTQDNAFWFEGARHHTLLIQRCTSCGTLRHPPLPACANCQSFEWDTVEASGRGTVYSFVVVHYPQVPSFEYPLPIGLIELEEGTRVVANLTGIDPADIEVGLPVTAQFVDFDDELSLPVFAPVAARSGRGLMDFAFSDEQLAVAETAAGLLGGLVTPERVMAVELSDDGVDRELWKSLAGADLLGLGVPEAQGGAGYGITELSLLLQAQGKVVAPVPLWATLVLGALPVAHFGTDAEKDRWLPGVISGDVMMTAAVTGASQSSSGVPSAIASPEGDGWVLNGTEMAVPHAEVANVIVVPARTTSGQVVLVLVEPTAPGVSLERAVTTNREIHPHLHLADVAVSGGDVLAGPDRGRAALESLLLAATIGLCALQVGVCEAALRQTAEYLNTRQQFGRALSTFQGTLLRAADAAIDIEAMRVTWLDVAWNFDTGRDAGDATRIAKWQASERGQRTVHATQHLHGGMGADITYPIHRYFLWGKQIELLLGGPSRQLSMLGARLAERALAEASS